MSEKRFHCGHCGEKVSKTLYYQHKRLYYSSAFNTWRSADDSGVNRGHETHGRSRADEFSFSDNEEEAGRDEMQLQDESEVSDGVDGLVGTNSEEDDEQDKY